jgi:hypothetical protein
VGEAGKAFWSKDLIEWTQVQSPASATFFSAETISGKAYLLGARGLLTSGQKDTPWTTTFRDLGANPFRGVTCGQDRFVAVGYAGQIAYSDDGKNWSIPSTKPKSKYLNSVVYGNGKFVAVGTANSIEISPDGNSWEKVYGADIGPDLRNIVWDGTAFLAAGDQGVFVSADGRDWQRQLENLYCYCVAAGDGVRVASRGISLMVATNGTDWTVATNTAPSLMWDGAYGNGRFVFVGDRGDAWSSTNGFDWVLSKVRPSWALNEVEFVGDRFVAAGIGGFVFSSVDGLVWNQHPVASPSQIFGLGYGKDRLVIAGAGTLLISDPIHGPTRLIRDVERIEGGRLRFSLLGPPGAFLGIQTSANLENWENLDLLFTPLGRAVYDVEMSNGSGFYRAIPVMASQILEPASAKAEIEFTPTPGSRSVLRSLPRFTDLFVE